jgi:hypothetical protein
MAKNIGGLCLIVVSKVSFRFISCSIVLQLWGSLQKHLSPITLEYQPLEAMRPSFLASKPSLRAHNFLCTPPIAERSEAKL